MNKIGLGAMGEAIAEKFLKKKGYKIIAKNCKFSGSELDIVAIEPIRAQKKQIKAEYKEGKIKSKVALKCRLSALEDVLVFVEVKYSSTKIFGEPMERVDFFKQKQIVKASETFIYKNRLRMPCRFDVVSIVGKEITHIENAFESYR